MECGFRNIHISGVTAFGNDTCTLLGGGNGVFDGVFINDFDLTLTGLEPCLGAQMVKDAAGSAFAIREAKNIQFRNVRINSEKAMLKHVIDAEAVNGLKISDCELLTGLLSGDSLRCVNVNDLQIENTAFPEKRNERKLIQNEKHNETRRTQI